MGLCDLCDQVQSGFVCRGGFSLLINERVRVDKTRVDADFWIEMSCSKLWDTAVCAVKKMLQDKLYGELSTLSEFICTK
jgi:hypothetical protein